ncbi:biotin transporter BioY [uncultured Desulfobulbus sp.]|uniref:biotin transporter BioY n=1 Tax=uncultured Desulfobulbus sp. TaxID=239745 RepID=UPI0029C63582|nr:biotin transporter BioY [uncultured Desulfobulbus sp.]
MTIYGRDITVSVSDTRMKMLATVFFAVLTAVCAKLYVNLWFTPVPVSLQVFVVLLAGLTLGSRLGALSQVAYLMMGLSGLPVFAGVVSGPAILAGPTAGYLIGFIASAYTVGLISERMVSKSRFGYLISGLAGIVVIHLFGVLWLTSWVGITDNRTWITSLKSAWLMGTAPFVLVDIIKAIMASGIVSGVKYSRSILGGFTKP